MDGGDGGQPQAANGMVIANLTAETRTEARKKLRSKWTRRNGREFRRMDA